MTTLEKNKSIYNKNKTHTQKEEEIVQSGVIRLPVRCVRVRVEIIIKILTATCIILIHGEYFLR